jgi:hypothetical protein
MSTVTSSGDLIGYQRRGHGSALVLRSTVTNLDTRATYTIYEVIEAPGNLVGLPRRTPPPMDEPVDPPRPWDWPDFEHIVAD